MERAAYDPSRLRPIYGGPTLLEALWNEMDRLMEALMTGAENGDDVCGRTGCDKGLGGIFVGACGHVDNGDKYRAQELAWVLAITTNPYDPSVDRIRAEAMERWNAAQDECRCSPDEYVYCHSLQCKGGENLK